MGKTKSAVTAVAVELLDARIEQLREQAARLMDRAVETKERYEEAQSLVERLSQSNGSETAVEELRKRAEDHARANLEAVEELRKVRVRLSEVEEMRAILQGGAGRGTE